MKVLLLSAYDAVSHRKWREGLVRHLGGIQWSVLALPPRNFAWRSRGSALTWAVGEKDSLEDRFDAVLATSMTDLAELKGLAPFLAATPTVVYFHENQFAYPERFERPEYLNFKLTNLYTALAADRVLFNSAWNRESFLKGSRDLLDLMPDGVPKGVPESVEEKSEVLAVPLEPECYRTGDRSSGEGPVTVVWNHRWEHDKAPDRFFQALDRLVDNGVSFSVNVLGQRFRETPEIFEAGRDRLGSRVLEWGYVDDRSSYLEILSRSDVVVSTALHDFQGLAVLEAVAAGCLPVVPDRLAYPEFFPAGFLYPSAPEDPEVEVKSLADRLEVLCSDPVNTRSLAPPDLSHLSWERLGPRYLKILRSVSGM